MAFPAAPTAPVYRKTKQGDYIIFGPESLIQVGRVTVHLKSGVKKQTQILSVGATFDVEGVPCRYGYQTVPISGASDAAAALGASKSTAPSSAKINLDVDSFMPDSAWRGEDVVPANYEDTDQFTGEFNMPPSTEAFTELFN